MATVVAVNNGKEIKKVEFKPPLEERREERWVPYKHAWSETPFLCCLSTVLPYWYWCRNFFLRNPIVSARVPPVPGISRLSKTKIPICSRFIVPWLREFHHSVTLGELLIIITGVVLTFYYSWVALMVPYPKESTSDNGFRASYTLIFVLAFASRNSILTFLLGVPYERQLFWHKLTAGVFLVVLSWAHGARALRRTNAQKYDVDTGIGVIAFYTAFPVLSFFLFRRYAFTVFYIVHMLLFTGAVISSITHSAYEILYGVAIWGVDVLFRYIYLSYIRAPKQAILTRLPANVIRLTFPKGDFEYSPGQYLFLMVPEINIFEWHPFSISSAPHQDFVSVHIRVLGDWTKRLYDLASKKGGGPVQITTYWEGPYGAPQIDVEGDKYQLLLLISGGIGITPLHSLANQVAYEADVQGRPMKKIWFVWSVADKYMIGANFEHDGAWRGGHSPPQLPTSFQPDIDGIHTDEQLAERDVDHGKEDPNILHTEFYLTRVRTQSELAGANISPALQPFVRFGRPDLANIFSTFARYAQIHGESRVGVMVCGPKALVDDVRILCGQRHEFDPTYPPVAFDYHAEIFEF